MADNTIDNSAEAFDNDMQLTPADVLDILDAEDDEDAEDSN